MIRLHLRIYTVRRLANRAAMLFKWDLSRPWGHIEQGEETTDEFCRVATETWSINAGLSSCQVWYISLPSPSLPSFPPSYKKRLKAKSHFTPRGYQIQSGFTTLAKITIIWQIEYRSLHRFLSWCLVFSFRIWLYWISPSLYFTALDAIIKLPIISWVMTSKYSLIGLWLPFYFKDKEK